MRQDEIEKILTMAETGSPETKRAALEVVRKLLTEEEAKIEGEQLKEEDQAKLLPIRYDAFKIKYDFKPGQLVRWKEGFQHKIIPKSKQTAVVIQVLDKPIKDEDAGAGSAYFQEALDIVLGVVDEKGVFLTFYYDSRRFEPAK